MKLSQGSSTTAAGPSNAETFDFVVKAESQDATVPGTNEKLKASNFPASHLKIGRWEVFIKLSDIDVLLFLGFPKYLTDVFFLMTV